MWLSNGSRCSQLGSQLGYPAISESLECGRSAEVAVTVADVIRRGGHVLAAVAREPAPHPHCAGPAARGVDEATLRRNRNRKRCGASRRAADPGAITAAASPGTV